MISPIPTNSTSRVDFEPSKGSFPTRLHSSTLCSMKKASCLSLIDWIFFPVTAVFNWILSRISLTTEELEVFEKLLESAFWGGGAFFYDRSIGEKRLREVVQSCDRLYESLSNKWFPNIEGILFLRVNLVKIKIRVHAALGEKGQVDYCRKLMSQLGEKLPEDIKDQVEYLTVVTGYSILIKMCNLFVKGGFFLCSLLLGKKRGRRDSNPQLPP